MQNLLRADTRQEFRPQYAGAIVASDKPDSGLDKNWPICSQSSV